jgi:hypothetical protein
LEIAPRSSTVAPEVCTDVQRRVGGHASAINRIWITLDSEQSSEWIFFEIQGHQSNPPARQRAAA